MTISYSILKYKPMRVLTLFVVILLSSVHLSVAPPGHHHEVECVHDDTKTLKSTDLISLASADCLHLIKYIYGVRLIRFQVKACQDFRLILTEGKDPVGHQTHILIGTNRNTRTCFAHEDSNECEAGPHHHADYHTGSLLSCHTYKSFWLKIHSHKDDIELGYGDVPGQSSIVTRSEYHKPRYLAVKTTPLSRDAITFNMDPMPVDGGWSRWSHWGSCSVTCDTGVRSRHRTCTSPVPLHGGHNCSGTHNETNSCRLSHCLTVDGGWSSWSHWGSCSGSCGTGVMSRYRTCTNPVPSHGGHDCSGNHNDVHSCNLSPCQIDGGWGPWKASTTCSASCNGGKQTWTRSCDSPRPAYGGKQCSGTSQKTEACNSTPCPVDGGWGAWTTVMSCSKTCGGGTMINKRLCNNPTPSKGGRACTGLMEEVVNCNMQPCTNASLLSSTPATTTSNPNRSACVDLSQDCKNGDALTRICHQSATAIYCKKSCGVCPVDGGWSEWQYSSCSQTCGGGQQAKIRKCDNPVPSHGGSNCHGQSFDVSYCNQTPCPVDGGWGSWSEVSGCSKTCGGGTRIMARLCSNPPASNGGKVCVGAEEMVELCNIQKC